MKIKEILNLQAGEETDRLIEEYVFERKLAQDDFVNHYSTDMKPAWDVVMHMMNHGWCPNLINDDNGRWALAFDGSQPVVWEEAFQEGAFVETTSCLIDYWELWCESAPLAICRAVLLVCIEAEDWEENFKTLYDNIKKMIEKRAKSFDEI